MAIYTKNGDRGETKVFDSKTGKLVGISKDSYQIKVIGAIDELNSWLGVVRSEIEEGIDIKKKLKEIQGDLFTINSILAGSNLKFSKIKIKRLEGDIDDWEGRLPVQKNFLYYGGLVVASHIFYARALCRRAEPSLVNLEIGNWKLEILAYINRLSDYLFILARKVNFDKKVREEFWVGEKSK